MLPLPDELVARCIDAAFEEEVAPGALFGRLATVCRAWLDPARRALHAAVSLHLPLKDDGRLRALIDSPGAATYIRTCSVAVPSYPFSIHKADGSTLSTVTQCKLAGLLSRCIRLRHLELEMRPPCPATTLDDLFVISLRSCVNLRSLSVSSFGAFSLSALCRILPSFPFLEHLHLAIDVNLAAVSWIREEDVALLRLRSFSLHLDHLGRLELGELAILLRHSTDSLHTLSVTFEAGHHSEQVRLAADLVALTPQLRHLSLTAFSWQGPCTVEVPLRTTLMALKTLKLDGVAWEHAMLGTLACGGLRELEVVDKLTKRGKELQAMLMGARGLL